MRIISGTYGGRLLHPPKDLPVRPTTDYAKTGLFNILAHRYNFHTLTVLDLYAGTGALTYEFISRGVTTIQAVDKHPGCIRYIRETLRLFEAPATCQAIQSDALRYLATCKHPFDIIIADAPYAETPAAALCQLVFENQLLRPKGLLIIEHESRSPLTGMEGLQETRKYGNVSFSFFTGS